ncbi:MAG: glycosyltransferase [Alphaproteobacteria bacterium]|nr:glycosyltransferase [Alphaproteobacteria bacterium]
MSKTVGIFLNQCLPLSEIFIYHQAASLHEYKPRFIACRCVPSPITYNIPVTCLNNGGAKGKIAEAIFKLSGKSRALLHAVKECDVIHAHFGPTGWLASRLTAKTGKPLIVTLHGFDILKNNINRKDDGVLQSIYNKNRELLGQRASKFICVSEFMRQKAIEFGFPEEKCVVHYMGIPLKEHVHTKVPIGGKIKLLAVGRLVPFKAHSKLIEAVSILQKEGLDVSLTIIGDGPLRKSLEKQAAESLVDYKFMGAQPHDVVLKAMSEHHVFCHSSVTQPNGQTEAFGLVLLEAQWAGLPVVAFRSGGVPEAISEGHTGFLAEEGDVQDFAEKLGDLIKSQETLEKFSMAAPEFVQQNFDNKKQSRILEEIYNFVLC